VEEPSGDGDGTGRWSVVVGQGSHRKLESHGKTRETGEPHVKLEEPVKEAKRKSESWRSQWSGVP